MRDDINSPNHLAESQAVQDQIYRSMSPAEKLRASMQMYWSSRKLKAAWLKGQHPDWTAEQVNKAVNEAFFDARS